MSNLGFKDYGFLPTNWATADDVEMYPFLLEWVKAFLDCAKDETYDHQHSSYNLKHIAEKILGHYISNDLMKYVMYELEFFPKNKTDINHVYKLNKKILNYLTKFADNFERSPLKIEFKEE